MNSSNNFNSSISEYDFCKYGVKLIVDRKSNYVEVAVKNIKYKKHKQSLQRWTIIIVTMYLMSIYAATGKLPLLFHAIIVGVLVCLLTQLMLLVEQEILKVANDFGIEKLTFFSLGRRNRIFVPINRVHKVIINEVIYFVSILIFQKVNFLYSPSNV